MAVILLTQIVIGAAYVATSLFLYGFGWGIFAAALLVLLAMKTFPEQ